MRNTIENKKIFNKGITLIALVITIVVLLILAGISISTLSGDNSILKQAGIAKQSTETVQEKELIDIAVISAESDNNKDINFNKLERNIKASFGENAKVDIVDNDMTGEEAYIIRLPNGNVYPIGINSEIIDIYVPENNQSGSYDTKVIGYSIALNGTIRMIFYFTMPEEKINSGTETIKISVGDEEPQTINVSSSTISRGSINGEKCYYVEAGVVAKGMSDTIKFCAYNNNAQDSDEYSYSIKECGNEIIRKLSSDTTQKKQEIAYYIKTMLNYGGKAQLYFNYNTTNLADEGIEVDTSYITDNYLDEYASIRSGEQTTKYKLNGISCLLEDVFTFRIYFKFPNEDMENFHPYIDNKATQFTKRNDGYIKVDFKPCAIDESNIFHDFYIKDNEGNICGQSMKVCVLTFVRSALIKNITEEKEMAKAIVAMYNAYNQFIGK